MVLFYRKDPERSGSAPQVCGTEIVKTVEFIKNSFKLLLLNYSILYPNPQTVLINFGLSAESFIFSRKWRI
jgi:hypothetical protein